MIVKTQKKELLDILKNINRKIIIVSKNINETLMKKYQSQYNNVVFINNNTFHDRFYLIKILEFLNLYNFNYFKGGKIK